jgi:DNA-3-methyladenine glycosylase
MSDPSSGHAVADLAPLDRRFYQRDTAAVARELIGKLLVRRLPEGLVAVRLVEVEAYLGVNDPAAHTFGGRRTARTEVMWGEAGHLYVYFTYGMHHCCNVVTRGPGEPEAVLLRAGAICLGLETVAARRGRRDPDDVLDGPARLCQGLGIERSANGCDLTRRDGIWLADDGLRVADDQLLRLPRVGVSYAGEAASWLLRFRVARDVMPGPAPPGRSPDGRAAGDAGPGRGRRAGERRARAVRRSGDGRT